MLTMHERPACDSWQVVHLMSQRCMPHAKSCWGAGADIIMALDDVVSSINTSPER